MTKLEDSRAPLNVNPFSGGRRFCLLSVYDGIRNITVAIADRAASQQTL